MKKIITALLLLPTFAMASGFELIEETSDHSMYVNFDRKHQNTYELLVISNDIDKFPAVMTEHKINCKKTTSTDKISKVFNRKGEMIFEDGEAFKDQRIYPDTLQAVAWELFCLKGEKEWN